MNSVEPEGVNAEPVGANGIEADPAGPSEEDLARIEREWPLIEAELAWLDAEIHALTAAGGPTPLDWRRLRRAEQRVLRAAFEFVAAEERAVMARMWKRLNEELAA